MSAFRLCFVCLGNICRSPMAEAVMRARLAAAGWGDRVVVDSAGTGDWHLGEDADPRTRSVLVAAGYPLSHVSRQIAPSWFAERDLIVAMDAHNVHDLHAMAPTPAAAAKVRLFRDYVSGEQGLDVPDPYYGGAGGFAEVLAVVERGCDALLEHLRLHLRAGDGM